MDLTFTVFTQALRKKRKNTHTQRSNTEVKHVTPHRGLILTQEKL